MKIFLIIFFFLFVRYRYKIYGIRETVLYTIGLFGGMQPLIYTFLACLFVQDEQTYHISKYWYCLSLFLILWNGKVYFTGLIFGGLAFIMKLWKTDWIGSADIFYLILFGLLLGFERMLVLVWTALVVGFVYAYKRSLIPFVSCMVLGFYLAYARGYSIFYWLCDII